MEVALTKGFLSKKYNKMLIASLLGWIVAIVGELADSIIGGLFISEEAVAATGVVAPIFSILYFLACLIGIGTGNVYSVLVGNFDTEKSHKVCGMTVIISIGAGIVLAVLMVVFKGAFFRFYGLGPEIESLAMDYYSCFPIMALVYPVYWLIYYLVAADGDSNLILVVDLVTAVGNAALSLILVQNWGVKGLAYGTIFSLLISGVFLIFHFRSDSNSIKFKFSFDWDLLKKVVISGSTASLSTLYIALIDIIMNKFISDTFGDLYLAAYTIVNFMLNMAQCFMCSTDAGSPFIGVSYGEKNSAALKKILKLCLRSTFIVSGIFSAFFLIFSKYVPAAYGINTPEIMDVCVYTVRVIALSYLCNAFVSMWTDYFPRIEKQGLGNLTGILYSLVTPIVLAIPFGKLWGYKGMIWGFFFTPVVTFIIISICIVAKYGVKAFPFVVEDSDAKIFIHELALVDDEITALNKEIDKELKSANVDKSIANKIEMMVEDTFVIAKNYNKGKKILADCTIMIDKEQIRLTTRDNGKIFDITKVDENIKSLEHYVTARLMESTDENIYMTAISFNRNSYVWKK